MAKFEISLIINTDGDFDFNNVEGYFKESFERYSKTVFVEEIDLKKYLNSYLETLFSNMKERIYNKYNQKEYLIEAVKNLNYKKNYYGKLNPLKSVLKDGYFDEIYFGGNQEIRLLIKKIESNSTNELFEMLQNKGLRLGQIFENIRKENDDDLFNISDEKFHQELVKMFEKTV